MKKIVKLTETDLYNIVRKTINEMDGNKGESMDDFFKQLNDVLEIYQKIDDLKVNHLDGSDSAENYLKLNIMYSDILYKLQEKIFPNRLKVFNELGDKVNYYGNLYNKKKDEM